MAQWDPDKQAMLEEDFSGYALGVISYRNKKEEFVNL